MFCLEAFDVGSVSDIRGVGFAVVSARDTRVVGGNGVAGSPTRACVETSFWCLISERITAGLVSR